MAIKTIIHIRFALWLLLFCTGLSNVLKASHETGTARLSSPTATLNSVLFIQDNKYPAIASMSSLANWGFYDKAFTNKLILGINRYSTAALADFVATVTVQVTSTAPQALGGTATIVTKTLSVKYEGRNDHTASSPHITVDQDVYTFTNGYKVSAKITGIAVSSSDPSLAGSTLPSNVYLEAQTDAERYYPIQQNASPFASTADVTVFYLQGSDEFEISWTRIPGAEEYDLEWLWLDDAKNAYWQNTPQLDFRNNSTRIRTSRQSYRISNVFEKGQVCFRVRGVGRASLAPNAWEKTAYTPWSWPDLSTISTSGLSASSVVLGSGSDYLFYVTLDGTTAIQTPTPSVTVIPRLHGFNKNWQYKATYAEEGKKKEVVSYFDGSLRSRQSVTKNNSDNNAIVGETYYDYNGRAAVQALPVPVADATIKFYQYNIGGQSAFNYDETTLQPYGKVFFDEEAATGTSTNCAVFVAGLDPVSGASNYYSALNINQQFAQGYVPDAEKFPISQTVYTNDNTGRIAAQGGVGKTHQIGTGHETRYFYGAPNQLELDRLFGSEVGYDKHYKKNMVVDANGQVSISYIDQEGRTIATALSGQGPSNLSNLKDAAGNVLYPAPTATNVLNADLLNKVQATDYDTDQDNNQLLGDKLSFSKKILVSTAGTYTISYDLDGTSFTYSCLPTNACYDCVYDLEINVFDNCMNNPPGFTKITQTLGNILPPSGSGGAPTSTYTLDTQCNQIVHFSTSQLNYSGNHLLVALDQGEYTITKTLKINQQALSYYLADYLKSNCVKQPADFDHIKPDTSGCGLTCDQCVAALGSLSDYIAANKGDTADWVREYKVCREPCEYVSLCESQYISMLADVSPGGQYGDWEDGNGDCNPALHAVSVYNEANQLPTIKNFTVGIQIPDWRHPFLRKSVYASDQASDFEAEYRDEDGALSKVYVTKYVSGTTVTYLPPLKSGVTPTPVNSANTGDGAQYYVKPQELGNVADFIASWQSSWARSLVFYHPEYPYYDWCLKNSTDTLSSRYAVTVGTGTNAVTGYITSSETYDSLLMTIDDITAVASGDLLKLCNPLSYDPYWTKNGKYYDHAAPSNQNYPVQTVGPTLFQKNGTASVGLTWPWNADYPALDKRYNQYRGTGISLPAFAALITTSCAIQYGQSEAVQLGCLGAMLSPPMSTTTVNNTGVDVILAGMPANLKNDYWNRYKSLYLSLKQEMQMEAAESYAMNGNYRGVNDGIGDPSFDAQARTVPFTEYYTGGSFSTFGNVIKQWYYPMASANKPQYCTPFTHIHYKDKIKRFPNATTALSMQNQMPGGDPGAQIYANTGLCPNAFYLQGLLDGLAVDEKLSNSSINLSAEPLFNQDLYKVVAGGTIPATYAQATWTGSYSGGALSAQMQIGSGALCPLALSFPSGSPFNFSNTGTGGTYTYLRLYQLTPGAVSGGSHAFTIKADITDISQIGATSPTFTTVTLNGSTCIPLTGCTFTPPCEPSTAAIATQQLMNAIASTGNMCSAAVSMSLTAIQPYFVNGFGALLGPGNWQWQVNGSLPYFIIKDVNAVPNPNSLTFTLSTAPCTTGSMHYFSQVSGSSAGTNVFGMQLNTYNSTGSTVPTVTAAITGTVNLNSQPLKMGECGFDLGKCNTPEHLVYEDMETFLYNTNTRSRLQATSTGSTEFTSIFNFGTHLRDRLANNSQTYNPTTQATAPLHYYWKKNTATSTATLLTGYFMASTLTSVPVPDASACSFSLSFSNTTGLSGQNLLSSNYTLSNLVLAPGPMVNLGVYNFSVTAMFGGTPFVLEGSSDCFAMRACDACVSSVTNSGSSSQTLTVNNYPCTGGLAFTMVSPIAGTPTNYPDQTSSCATSTLVYNPAYAISQSVNFSAPDRSYDFVWNGYNSGSSLFIAKPDGAEFSYTQSYAFTSACNQYELRMKLHNHGVPNTSGTYTLAYNSSDFMIRNNYSPLTFISSSATADPNWTEYRFGPFVNINGTPNTIELSGFYSIPERYLGLDDIQIVGTGCGVLPCSETDTILPFPEVEYEDPCVQYALDAAENEGDELYNAYIDSVKNAFVQAYIKKCIGQAVETMYMKYNAGDYHFTLYYYDQAGNLVRTVPPEGVHVETNAANLAIIRSERAANTPYGSKTYYTSHTLPTTYRYNSLNQLVRQETPDAGVSRFWYDALGRLVASQNAKQAAASTSGNYVYSYTRYDDLGRIAQVGEMTISSDLRPMTAQAVAALVASGTGAYPDNLTGTSPGRKREVTTTYYGDDAAFTPLVSGAQFAAGSQEYLRSRVAAVTIEDADDFNATTYNHATHYSYDVHGNVKELIQENKDISGGFSSQRLKKLAYSYDLISGKVNEVAYQDGLADMFKHRYEYDADNRITAVYTSKNNVIWERDAKYFYYLHGPLARVETGHDKVQGTDYAYTLHGWIKGVNSNLLKATHDIGKDGNGTLTVSSADVNKFSGRDVYSYALTYFNNSTQKDYKAINGISGTSTDFMAAAPSVQTADLYNGNIRQMAGSYLDASSPGKTYGLKALLRNFTYDQLNRIETASANDNLNAGTNSWGATSSSSLYTENFNYDQNGNILHAQRNGNQSGSYAMDNLTYHYVSGTNRLAYVTDAVSGDPYSQGISNQGAGNYDYDAIGNLIKDNAEGISNIDWTVYGKIKRITFSNGKPNLLFKYDASGNRISKTAFMGSTPATTATTTYYVRDAQGNVMATYEQKPDGGNNPTFGLTERHIYGSSRLGLDNSPVDFTPNILTPLDITSVQRTLNYRSYEMTNHLGNVMAVVSDRKIGVYQSTIQLLSRIFDDGNLSSIQPDQAITSLSSNALKVIPQSTNGGINVPFGPTQQGKIYKVECDIDYGSTTFANFMEVYIYNYNSQTSNVSNLSSYTIYGSGHYTFYYIAGAEQSYLKLNYRNPNPTSNYFLVDNISILDENASTIDHFTGEVLSANDYYAFGATMPGRSFTSSSYRYGFNGKENDKESGTQDYGMRIYNPNLGKFLSVDPLAGKYPFKTPYDFAENTPIWGNDLDGLELNINPYRTILLAANKSNAELAKVNTFAKLTNNYQLQAQVGVCKWVVNGLYSFAAMGGEQNPQVSTSTIPPCGGVAPYSKDQQTANKAKAPEEPFEADAKKIVYGDISEKTVGVLNVAAALSPLLTEESSIGGYQRDMRYWKSPTESKINSAAVKDLEYYNGLKSAYLDCSEIAEKLYQSHGGNMLKITSKKGWMKGVEYGQSEEWTFHQVYESNGYIYDPMLSKEPMPKGDYVKKYNEMNPQGLNYEYVDY